jgi:AraC-like DNA-binding protein
MELNLENGIKLLCVFQAFFFSFYLILSKDRRKVSNYTIIIFQLLLALNVGQTFLPEKIIDALGNFYVFIIMSAFLIPPAIFLYIQSSIDKSFNLSWKQSIHIVPFIVLNIVIIPYVYLENLKENPTETEVHITLNKVFFIIWYCQFLLYLFLSFLKLKRHKKLYLERFSASDISRYNYLNWFIIIVSIVFTISAIKNFSVYNSQDSVIHYLTNIGLLSMLILFCWITYMALNSPEIFSNNYKPLPLVKDLVKAKNLKVVKDYKLKSSPEIQLQTEKIKAYMKNESPYLNASFSLGDLASQTNIPVRELSILINHHLNKHFFDFVNEYRIEKAKQLLISPDRKDYTILEILYEVGFNSKSSFNTAFKKQTQLTPTQYRKNYLKSAS